MSEILYANCSSGNLFSDVLGNFFKDKDSEDFLNKEQVKYATLLFDLTVSNKNYLDDLIKSKLKIGRLKE